MTDVAADPENAAEIRDQVVDTLIRDGVIVSPQVEAAMRRVPRHRFTPEATVEEAYRPYAAVVTKKNEHGISISSVSAPQIQAMMLEQAAIEPGMRVLEIGSGGYNAALIAELVGDSGQVTTVDIDQDVTARAERLLAENGYPQVRVVLADAEDGLAAHAPYDRIIVTAGAWDIPPAWITQLTERGRLVVPLRLRGLTRSIAFERRGGHLLGLSARACGFVPMQGAGAHQEQLLLLCGTDEIGLRFDDGLPGDPSLLDNTVRTPRLEVWTGVVVERTELVDTLQLYLATALPGFCIMAVDPALDTGLVEPNHPSFSLAAVDGCDFAYLRVRPTADDRSVEYGIHAFGPQREAFAEKMAGHVRTWAREHRGGPGPQIRVFPARTPDEQLPGHLVLDKKHSRVTFSWPSATAADQAVPPASSEGDDHR